MKRLKIDLDKLAAQYGFDLLTAADIEDEGGKRSLVLFGDSLASSQQSSASRRVRTQG